MSKQTQVEIAACVFELGDAAPTEIQLTPAGQFRARDGRPKDVPAWYIDADVAAQVIALTETTVDKFVVDYDHQTLYAKDNGQKAPAAGWYRKLEWREGVGLFAVDVEWTDAAKEAIANKEYRYISPVIAYHPKTGQVLYVLMAALTNYAAIDGMADLAAMAAAHFSIDSLNSHNQGDDAMNEALLKLLGLSEGASEDDINKAVAALQAKLDAASEHEKTIAALKAEATTPDPAKFVSVETMTKLQGEIADLSARLNQKEVDDLVDAAMSEGKLLTAQEEWARNLGKTNLEALKGYLDNAQPIAALKGNQTGGKDPEGDDNNKLDDAELAVCKATGIDPEEFNKTKVAS